MTNKDLKGMTDIIVNSSIEMCKNLYILELVKV